MMTFFAQAKLAFLSQNRGLKLPKFGKIQSNFYVDKKDQNSKIFAPRFARGEFLKSENFLKLKESPFPLYPPPRSTLTGRSRPESYASAAAQTGQNPKFSILKKISKCFSHDVYDDVFCLGKTCFFGAKIDVKNFQNLKKFRKIFIKTIKVKLQNFSPLASLGAVF